MSSAIFSACSGPVGNGAPGDERKNFVELSRVSYPPPRHRLRNLYNGRDTPLQAENLLGDSCLLLMGNYYQTRGHEPPALQADTETAGAVSADGRIWGSYLHGIFDADPFRRWFIDRLRVRRDLAPLGKILTPYDLEPAFDRLAATVRQALDMKRIHQLPGI